MSETIVLLKNHAVVIKQNGVWIFYLPELTNKSGESCLEYISFHLHSGNRAVQVEMWSLMTRMRPSTTGANAVTTLSFSQTSMLLRRCSSAIVREKLELTSVFGGAAWPSVKSTDICRTKLFFLLLENA